MASIEELLNVPDEEDSGIILLADQEEYCMLESDTSRKIIVPERYQNIGVESDEDVERIKFKFPKIVGDNKDLSTFGIRINYENANGNKYSYASDDVKVSGEYVTFSWRIEREVTAYKGKIKFIVCAIKTDSNGTITNEWNTTLAYTNSLEGLEVDFIIPEEEQDIVKALIAQATQKLTEMSVATQKAENATTESKVATQEAINATEDARDVIKQIQKESYMHTALQTFINEVSASPTKYGNAIVEKLEGYIKQRADPSPDNPQFIHGVGDTGFFDGELLQGGYNRSGQFFASSLYVCSSNPIPCKENDSIEVITEKKYAGGSVNIIFFDKNGNFLSFNEGDTSNAPLNTEYCMINLYEPLITPQTAGHITVTINGNYAVILDMVGNNLFDIRNVEPYTSSTSSIINNYNESLTIKTALNSTSVSSGKKLSDLCPSLKIGKTYFLNADSTGTNKYIYLQGANNTWNFGESLLITQNMLDSIVNFYASGVSTTAVISNIIVSEENADYIPYQSSRTYIPISSPLYSGDKIYQKDMQYRVSRQWGVAVFDGSGDWTNVPVTTGNNVFSLQTSISEGIVEAGQKCNMFELGIPSGNTVSGEALNSFVIGRDSKKIYVCTSMSIDEFKQKITQEPLVIVYPLAQPTTEPLSQDGIIAAYSLMACDEITNISIAGVPEDAEVSNQLYLPRNIDGAWNTTAFALGRRNEIAIKELSEQIML